jgi:hypothetical protein
MEAEMWVLDVVWIVSLLVGAVLALRLPSSALAILLGVALLITSFILWGYSWNYENWECQTGEVCPTGLRIIEILNSVFFPLSASLLVVGFARSLWTALRDLKNRGRASPGGSA